jgi:hypothetical protein
MSTGLAASIQARLVRHAHALKIDPNLVLVGRYTRCSMKAGRPAEITETYDF